MPLHQAMERDMTKLPAKQVSAILQASLPGGGAALALILLLTIASLA